MKHLFGAVMLCLLVPTRLAPAQTPIAPSLASAPPAPAAASASTSNQFVMDRFVAYTVTAPGSNFISKAHPALKGMSIDLGGGALVCFDTDLLRYAAGWRGTLDFSRTMVITPRGSGPATLRGRQVFGSREQPGLSFTSGFDDPRPGSVGPLPPSLGRYRGLYRAGDKIVLAYEAGGAELLDCPEFDPATETFSRTISLGPLARPIRLLVTDIRGEDGLVLLSDPEGSALRFQGPGAPLLLGVVDAEGGVKLAFENDRVVAKIPASSRRRLIKIEVNSGGESFPAMQKRLASPTTLVDPATRTNGGPARWGAEVVTRGATGRDDAAYTIDTIALPERNPWRSWMRVSGFDFFEDGRAAVATLSGDVWIASGLDAGLKEIHWRRFATGLYEPLGLKIVHDVIYVLGRDQITIPRDLNGDGEADFYECFNNGGVVAAGYHAYHMDLQTDSSGNFYYAVDGNLVDPDLPMHGCVVRVSKDGRATSVFATGLRAANGMGVGPHDEITSADNQGHWTPVCRINLMKEGGFYGYKGDPRMTTAKTRARFPSTYDEPLCWIPMAVDNSSGAQVWVEGDRWGPLSGRMLHTSYGQCTLLSVLSEHEGDHWQAGVWTFPLRFASGIMRARFNPKDGQLYVGGLKGWQTSAAKDGSFQRVRRTGKPLDMPLELNVFTNGVRIAFSEDLKPAVATDPQNYAVRIWNYQWTAKYGSDDFSPSDPGKKGQDTLQVEEAKLSKSGRSVFLIIPGLKPVMQMRIQYKLETAAARPLNQEINSTIHFLRSGPVAE